MRDLVKPSGEITPWLYPSDLPENSEGRLVERIDDPLPNVSRLQVVVPGDVVFDPEAGVTRQRWSIREATADELRRTWDASDFIRRVEQFAPGALDLFDGACQSTELPAPVTADLRMARRLLQTVQHIESDHPDTLRFIHAAIALGIMTQQQADQILNGP